MTWITRNLTTILMFAAVALIGVALLAMQQCSARRQVGREAATARSQAEAVSQSAADAINTVGAANGRETAIDATTRDNAGEIAKADGAGDVVKPALREARKRALCHREIYRETPQCATYR